MEHAQNIRIVIACAVLLVATSVGLAGCATPVVVGDTGRVAAESADHRALARAFAERYVQEQLDRGRRAISHRMLARAAAEHYVDGLIRSARDVEAAARSTHPAPNLRQLLEADRRPDESDRAPMHTFGPPLDVRPLPKFDRPVRQPRQGVLAF